MSDLICPTCGRSFRQNKARQRYCSRRCGAGRRKVSVSDRFWANVVKTDSCWLWTGDADKDGYGRIGRSGAQIRAHRFSYEIHNGAIPQGMLVCHTCDTPACVRPDHLWLGTAADNNEDMGRKGRRGAVAREKTLLYQNPERSPSHIDPKITQGENNGRAKLTWEQVSEIRSLSGSLGTVELAQRYGISRGNIRRIVTGKYWK